MCGERLYDYSISSIERRSVPSGMFMVCFAIFVVEDWFGIFWLGDLNGIQIDFIPPYFLGGLLICFPRGIWAL